MTFETGQDHAPAFGRALRVIREHAFVRQCQSGAGTVSDDLDGDPRHFGGEFRYAKREDETAWAFDLEIFADMLDILGVAPHDCETAADTRVDFDPNHLSRGRGEEPPAGCRGIEPGVEYAFGRCRIVMCDLKRHSGTKGH